MTPTNAPDIPASLATAHCPNCGYALAGLPSAGTCPECGRGYDQSVVVLYGWGRGRHESVANAEPSRVVLVGFWWILGWLGIFIPAVFTLRPSLLLIPLGFLIAIAAYLWSRRRTVDHPGLVQVRLDANGVAQVDDLAGSPVLRGVLAAWGWVSVPVAAAVVITFYWRGDFQTATFCILMMMLAAMLPVLWQHSRRVRARMRAIRDGAIADAGMAYAEPTAWRSVVNVSLLPLKDDHYYLKLTGSGAWGLTSEAVEAEIRCTPEQARELWQYIDGRVARARR